MSRALFLLLLASTAQAQPSPAPRRENVVDQLFGVAVPDPYRWLETVNDETKRWTDGEDARARKYLSSLPGRERLAARLRDLVYVERWEIPLKRGKNVFQKRTPADAEKPIYWVNDRVLLDAAALSKDGTVSVTHFSPSWDGKKAAYLRHADNQDEGVLYVRDVATGQDSEIDRITNVRNVNLSWSSKSDGFYYNYEPPAPPGVAPTDRGGYAEVRYHKLGTPPKEDALVHGPILDASRSQAVWATRDGHWLVYYLWLGYGKVEMSVKDLRKPKSDFVPLAVGLDSDFSVDEWKDRFYVRTNWKAQKYRVLRGQAGQRIDQFEEIVPEDPGAVLDGLTLVGGRLGLSWLRDVHSELELRDLDGKRMRKIGLPTLGASEGWGGEPDDDIAYYNFSSYTVPPQIWKISVKSGKSEIYWKMKAPFEAADLEVKQEWFTSKDGAKVPMFVVRHKDAAEDAPFLMTGYGGFAISSTPDFSSVWAAWLAMGGNLAEVSLRGGGEFGKDWHEAGMLHRKQNVFDDFIAAAEHLIATKQTRASSLAILGGSNGGLLVGAALTQRPELFRAVVCMAPLLDMVRYTRFGTGKAWTSEYGSPEKADDFRVLHAYSPYHRVKRGAYPSVLLDSPESDDRVDPMHARKMAAALMNANTSGRPVLLRVERHAAHAGADRRQKTVERYTDFLSYLADQLGVTSSAP